MADVRLLEEAFDPATETERFAAAHGEAGGIATFIGKVRPSGGVEALELSHYAPLTLSGMEALACEAERRWDIMGISIIHRTGVMLRGESIVFVAAASRHRRDAIDAVDFTMDHLKSQSWFWKREKRADGWHWIEPREQDHADLKRWRDSEPEA